MLQVPPEQDIATGALSPPLLDDADVDDLLLIAIVRHWNQLQGMRTFCREQAARIVFRPLFQLRKFRR